jgi:hypothetical protein
MLNSTTVAKLLSSESHVLRIEVADNIKEEIKVAQRVAMRALGPAC